MYDVILVRYGEIGLKGQNRSTFEDQLVRAIRRACKGISGLDVHKEYGRIVVAATSDDSKSVQGLLQEATSRLTSVFGIVSVSPAIRMPLDLDVMKDRAAALIQRTCQQATPTPSTFKVQTRRPNKRFPLTTPELNAQLGAHILRAGLGLSVDVHAPDLTLFVEVRERFAYAYTQSIPGPGGLPVGSSSRALLLLSGGIDSPVAGWLAMKRGIRLEAIHFHSPPFTSERSKEKVLDLAEVLSGYAVDDIPVHVVHFTPIQQAIRMGAPEAMTITLMRRAMVRIADAVATRRNIPALVTGESVGQVASQTLESMHAINAVTSMPILRPLVAMDKEEIVELAKRIGTYELSVQPFEDCCTLFVPKRPEIRPQKDRAERVEAQLNLEPLIEEAVEDVLSKEGTS